MKTYSAAYFSTVTATGLSSARRVVPLVLRLTGARSVVDIGCATGAWLSVFQEGGVDEILGVDGDYVDRSALLIPEERFVPHDLERPIDLGRSFDLAVSLETAEHLTPDAAGRFVSTLVRLAPVVLFSAAIPNQGGTNHYNEQWQDYWIDLFGQHFYRAVDVIRPEFWDGPAVDYPYAQNGFMFVRDGHELAEVPPPGRMPARVVHPETYTAGLEYLWDKLRARQLPRTVAEVVGEALTRRTRALRPLRVRR